MGRIFRKWCRACQTSKTPRDFDGQCPVVCRDCRPAHPAMTPEAIAARRRLRKREQYADDRQLMVEAIVTQPNLLESLSRDARRTELRRLGGLSAVNRFRDRIRIVARLKSLYRGEVIPSEALERVLGPEADR